MKNIYVAVTFNKIYRIMKRIYNNHLSFLRNIEKSSLKSHNFKTATCLQTFFVKFLYLIFQQHVNCNILRFFL